ncbi:hypothetical protein [Thalassobius sp. I31.1]|uniref:hypothetical protein n=1 Tax=Thalassobius sp. I31.1 TaxID=2109912 RepID=UPI00130021BE|nr:hypothetical protein [Thalassobius sp. I31.1]
MSTAASDDFFKYATISIQKDEFMSDESKQLTELFRTLGAESPEQWASSQVHENIPQLQRYLFIRQAWSQVMDETDDSWIENIVEAARRNPDAPFSGQGQAIERMLALGVARSDIVDLARCSQAEMISALCYLLDDPSLHDEQNERVQNIGWCLVSTNEDFKPTAEIIGGLHESFLSADPTGREMRPRKKTPPT